MELRVLRYFVTVAEEGSISDAAKALHVTQPTLSRQLAQLETEMGAPLFTRGRSGIELTDRGAVLHRYALDILALANKAEEEVAMPKSSVAGIIHIGAGETQGFKIIAAACARVRKRYPGITFDVHDGTSADLKEHFARGFFDFLLDCNSGENAEFNQLTLPQRDLWGVVVRQDDPLATLDAARAEDLLNRALIVPPRGLSRALRRWAGSVRPQLERQIVCTHGLPLNSKYLVSAGVGIMFSYDGLVSGLGGSRDPDDPNSLCFVPLEPRVEAINKILWRKVMPTKPMQALIDELTPLCAESSASSAQTQPR